MSLSIGKAYEAKAKNLLKRYQYQILYENYRCRLGEIDLIVKLDQSLVFVEVKYRHQANYGHVLETVTYSKRRKLIKTAEYFMLYHQQYQSYQLRFDVIAFQQDDKPYWIKGAFGV
ncbi:YraN family protein [Thiotrichales bacterium 19S11-10]|nr:YraN family protein [Thiotrichales bacterium 19S11-10]MCF6807402.1 YraN family protein [Thiotrichales bacterium 19S9-11]MCF6811371.1 YraN family protein [Thiotrichales bacterium 19S9-12]